MNDARGALVIAGYLLTTQAVRERAGRLLELTAGGDGYFKLDESRLDVAADCVVDTIGERYPDLNIPYHSRWRHFRYSDSTAHDRYLQRTADFDPLERARTGVDLIVPSVLLDAGAGPDWRYTDPDGAVAGRSEGLALASLHMFMDGALSCGEAPALRTVAQQLIDLSSHDIQQHFQVTPANPLVGVAGRTGLLNRLGRAITANPLMFPGARPGGLVDWLYERYGRSLAAGDILAAIIAGFGAIWPGRITLAGVNLGDTWAHAGLGERADALVPFHKLSQWLAYSIIETLDTAGFEITGIDELTGLAEYRNGGLFIDSGVIQLKDQELAAVSHAPASPLIVEWRALTVVLLDRLADIVRARLKMSSERLPLPKILEGGTWAAGRRLAAARRNDGSPPLTLASDGTVF